jgi:hypothetical protein
LLAAEKPDEHTLKDFAKKPQVQAENNSEVTKKVQPKKKGKKGKAIIEEEPKVLNPGDPDYLKAIMENLSATHKNKVHEEL